MCVLSDREIEEYVACGKLRIEPFIPEHMTPNGIDLCMHEAWIEGIAEKFVNAMVNIPPHTRFMLATREFLSVPDDLVGMIWLKTSLARKGVTGSFGLIDAGFAGTLTLAFYNSSNDAITLNPDAKIVQVCFVKMSKPAGKLYAVRSGHYQNQKGVTFSRI